MNLSLKKTKLFSFILFFCISSLIFPLCAESKSKFLKIDLKRAMQIGIANHFALKAIRGKRRAIRKLISEKWRQFLPVVGLSYEMQKEITRGFRDTRFHDLKLTLEQLIYDGGKTGLELDIARLEELLTRDEFKIIYNRLRLDIQIAFIKVLAARGKIQLHGKSLQRSKLQLKYVRYEEKVGFATYIQVLDVASKVQEIKLALLKSRNEYVQSIHDLKLILNLDYSIGIEIEGDLFKDYQLASPVVYLRKLVSKARVIRPEVLKSKVNIRRLKKQLEIAKNYRIPKFSIGSYYSKSGEKLSIQDVSWGIKFKVSVPVGANTSINSGNIGKGRNITGYTGQKTNKDSENVSSSSTLQVYDNMSYDRKILENKIMLGEALTEFNRLLHSIAIEINKAYDNLLEAWGSVHIGTSRVYFQYESLRIKNVKYIVGEIKRSDIVYAETELVKAQEELTDSIARYMMSSFELESKTGLSPGSLKLFVYKKGKGNSFLVKIISEDIKKIRINKRIKK